jgi:hypothetical protein
MLGAHMKLIFNLHLRSVSAERLSVGAQRCGHVTYARGGLEHVRANV